MRIGDLTVSCVEYCYHADKGVLNAVRAATVVPQLIYFLCHQTLTTLDTRDAFGTSAKTLVNGLYKAAGT